MFIKWSNSELECPPEYLTSKQNRPPGRAGEMYSRRIALPGHTVFPWHARLFGLKWLKREKQKNKKSSATWQTASKFEGTQLKTANVLKYLQTSGLVGNLLKDSLMNILASPVNLEKLIPLRDHRERGGGSREDKLPTTKEQAFNPPLFDLRTGFPLRSTVPSCV